MTRARESFLFAVLLALAALRGLPACDEERGEMEAPDAGAPRHGGGPSVSDRPVTTPDGGALLDTAEYPFPLPPGFPKPYVPASNPLTPAKVELGRHLFYDVRLSRNQAQSCGTCHEQARAFTDGRATAVGSAGQGHPRNSMTLTNVAYAPSLTWANPTLTSLETQAAVPLLTVDPIVELGIGGAEDEVLGRLTAEPRYRPLFADAFPTEAEPFTLANVQRALASFQRTLVSGRSRFDRYLYDHDGAAITMEEKRGHELFQSEALECFHCHGGFNFTDAVTYRGFPAFDLNFHNTGLYNLDGRGAFPAENVGLFEFTGAASDMGRFKAPTLRNVAVTAPYMHDGSIATLEEVVAHYAAGGRTLSSGPHAGVGSQNPYKSGFIVGFTLPPADTAALVAFLRSLTDEAFLTDPHLSDPWGPPR